MILTMMKEPLLPMKILKMRQEIGGWIITQRAHIIGLNREHISALLIVCILKPWYDSLTKMI